jgi:hypothetical protein
MGWPYALLTDGRPLGGSTSLCASIFQLTLTPLTIGRGSVSAVRFASACSQSMWVKEPSPGQLAICVGIFVIYAQKDLIYRTAQTLGVEQSTARLLPSTSGYGPLRQLVQRGDMSGVEGQADIARTSLTGCRCRVAPGEFHPEPLTEPSVNSRSGDAVPRRSE